MSNKFLFIFGISALLLLDGCTSAISNTKSTTKRRSSLANPAATRCLQDGYRLEFIYSPEGVPLQGLCVNDRIPTKCEEWAYFRGECRLDRAAPPPPPPELPTELELDELPDMPKVKRIKIGHG